MSQPLWNIQNDRVEKARGCVIEHLNHQFDAVEFFNLVLETRSTESEMRGLQLARNRKTSLSP